MNRNRLYVFLSAACAIGFVWLALTYVYNAGSGDEPGVCFFKRITQIPCPSCGSTRSVLSLLKGDLPGALLLNPFGVIILTIMVVVPLWILFDVLGKQATFYQFYKLSESFLRRRWVAIPLILIVLLNWIWNVCKGF